MAWPGAVYGPHEPRDRQKLNRLIESMRRDGWTGRPLLAVHDGDHWDALTGSHRSVAAMEAKLERIPLYVVADTEGHVDTGYSGGRCPRCRGECKVFALLAATDEDELIAAVRRFRDATATRLVEEEVDHYA